MIRRAGKINKRRISCFFLTLCLFSPIALPARAYVLPGVEDFGIAPIPLAAIKGGDAKQNAAIASEILAGRKGPQRDAVLLNAAAALCVAGKVDSPEQGARRAAEAIDSGAAKAKLEAWIAFGRKG